MSEQAAAKVLSFDDIAQKDDTTYETIDVPEWGGEVHIGTLNAADLLEFVESNDNPILKKIAGVRLLVKSMVGPDKKRLADSPEKATKAEQMFMQKDARVITTVVQRILRLNKMDKKSMEAEKNDSGEAPTAASPTA